MDKVLLRLESCIRHLIAINEFFSSNDKSYEHCVSQLHEIRGYDAFARSVYSGTFGREMQLSDLLTYVLISRGTIWGMEADNRADYLRILLTTVNQLLVQEHITYFP